MRPSIKLTAFAILLFIAACTKPDDDGDDNNTQTTPIVVKTRTELLTAGKWQLSFQRSIYSNFNGLDSNITTLEEQDECEKDNFSVFNANGTIMMLNGKMLCDPSEQPEEVVGKWQLVEGDTKLKLGEANDGDTYHLLELSPAIFRIALQEGDTSKGDFRSEEYIFKNVL